MIPYISPLTVKNSCALYCTNILAQTLEGYRFQSPNRQLQHFFLFVIMFFCLAPQVPADYYFAQPRSRPRFLLCGYTTAHRGHRRTEAPAQTGTHLLCQSYTVFVEGARGSIKSQCHFYTDSWS